MRCQCIHNTWQKNDIGGTYPLLWDLSQQWSRELLLLFQTFLTFASLHHLASQMESDVREEKRREEGEVSGMKTRHAVLLYRRRAGGLSFMRSMVAVQKVCFYDSQTR